MVPLTVLPNVTREIVLEDLLKQLKQLHDGLLSLKRGEKKALGERFSRPDIRPVLTVADQFCVGRPAN
jgi:hypothetical protein